MKTITLKYITCSLLLNFALTCFGTNPETKEVCFNQSDSYGRCCYNGNTNKCYYLNSNRLKDYYALLERENTKNIDCGFTAKDEIDYCKRIIPYPTSNSTACYEYDMIIPDVSIYGDKRSYRCCMDYDNDFGHHCDFNLMGRTEYEIEVLKRGAVSGGHSYCKNNNYNDTLLKCAYSNSVGPSSCSKNIISTEDAFYYEGYLYDRCCYVSYDIYQACSPFPSDDDYIEEYMAQKNKEGLSPYIVKCGKNEINNSNNTEDYGREVTVAQCESIIPKAIKDCTSHTILNSEIKTIQGYKYDSCCFYEVGNGDNSCVALPKNNDFLASFKANSKYWKSKINLVDCKSNYILNYLFISLIIQLLF